MKSYWRSIYSGVVYAMPIDWIPQFGGWEAVSEETYNEYMGR